jgi:Fe-S-cluster containining protein
MCFMDSSFSRSYFFDDGLRFECQRCGACCTGEPGTIYVGPDEILRIAEFLQTSPESFIRQYLYPFRHSHSIREHADGRCFCYANGCTIYPVRPNQCKSFPFWFDNLRSETQWLKVSDNCPGIGQGRLYTKEQILEIVQSDVADSRWSVHGA